MPRSPSQATEFNALARRNAHRTGHADRPHPALGQDLTPSPTTGLDRAVLGVRAGSARKGADTEVIGPSAQRAVQHVDKLCGLLPATRSVRQRVDLFDHAPDAFL